MWTKSIFVLKAFLKPQLKYSNPIPSTWPRFGFSSTKKNKRVIDRDAAGRVGLTKFPSKPIDNEAKDSFKSGLQNEHMATSNIKFSSYTGEAKDSVITRTSAAAIIKTSVASAKEVEKTSTNLKAFNNIEMKSRETDHNKGVIEEEKKERLSKFLSRSNVCSRRQAERMIEAGLILVDNKRVKENMLVNSNNKIKIFSKQGEKTPLKEDTRMWVFYKPIGLICTHDDPQGRPTVFDYLKNNSKIGMQHLMSVGRLDYNSEGLLILTNDGELARIMELPENKLERVYEVRVYGTLDENKLEKIRKGVVIKRIKYGPFTTDIIKRQTSNTWLRIRLTTGKNREIRRVMQHFNLRVNRLKRIRYGSYTLLGLNPGEVFEVSVAKEVKTLLYYNYRAKLKEAEAYKLSVDAISIEAKPKIAELDQNKDKIDYKQIPDSKEKKIEGRRRPLKRLEKKEDLSKE